MHLLLSFIQILLPTLSSLVEAVVQLVQLIIVVLLYGRACRKQPGLAPLVGFKDLFLLGPLLEPPLDGSDVLAGFFYDFDFSDSVRLSVAYDSVFPLVLLGLNLFELLLLEQLDVLLDLRLELRLLLVVLLDLQLLFCTLLLEHVVNLLVPLEVGAAAELVCRLAALRKHIGPLHGHP